MFGLRIFSQRGLRSGRGEGMTSMRATITSVGEFTGEIRVKEGRCPPPGSQRWPILQLWDEEGLVDLLCHRTGKSEAEVRQLLESYQRPVSTPA